MKMSSSQTPFQRALLAAVDQGQVEGVIKMMEDMTPSALGRNKGYLVVCLTNHRHYLPSTVVSQLKQL